MPDWVPRRIRHATWSLLVSRVSRSQSSQQILSFNKEIYEDIAHTRHNLRSFAGRARMLAPGLADHESAAFSQDAIHRRTGKQIHVMRLRKRPSATGQLQRPFSAATRASHATSDELRHITIPATPV